MRSQELADSFYDIAFVLSVERTSDGGYGDIRIEAANGKAAELIGAAPVPGTLYDGYMPRDLNFEDRCFRAAVNKEPVHSYIRTSKEDKWLNVFVIPVDYEDGDICRCVYTARLCTVDKIDFSSAFSSETSEDVLKTCIKLHGTDDFKRTMAEVIKDIRLICRAEVCTTMLVDHSTGTCSVLATSIRENSTIKRVTQFVNFYDIANSWLKTIGDSDCLIIKSEKDMEYISVVNNPWYLTLVEAGVDSVVMFPLRYNNEVLGFIWATNFDTNETDRIKETLELTTFFLSSQIASYNMLRRLEHISYTDMLTGVMNRNAMNNRVNDIVSGKEKLECPFGVVFADLNGLKEMNDDHGHTAGDILLKKAAILLQEVFAGFDVYRAGGDEFMVILTGCSEEELERRVGLVRERENDPDGASLAAGRYFSAEGCDIRSAMHFADEDMYRQKERYYAAHPDKRRSYAHY